MDARPEETKQGMEEPDGKQRLTTEDASSTKTDFHMQALKQPFDGPLEKRKRVRILLRIVFIDL